MKLAFRRSIWAIVAALALTLSLATPAAAASEDVIGIGTDIPSPDGSCNTTVGLADGTIYYLEGTWTSKASNSGNITFTCKGELQWSVPDHAVNISSTELSIGCWDAETSTFFWSLKWDLHITPLGKATFSCHYNKPIP